MSPVSPFLAPDRDGAFKPGRIKAGGGTIYYTLPGATASGASTTGGVTDGHGTDYYTPFFCDAPIVVDQMAFEVTTLSSGKNMRVGIYRADTDLQPTGAPLADSGDISVGTTGVKTYTPGTPLLLPRGRYLTVHNNDDNTATLLVRAYFFGYCGSGLPTTLAASYIQRLTVARTYAAFPTPGTPWTTVASGTTAGFNAAVLLRVSTP